MKLIKYLQKWKNNKSSTYFELNFKWGTRKILMLYFESDIDFLNILFIQSISNFISNNKNKLALIENIFSVILQIYRLQAICVHWIRCFINCVIRNTMLEYKGICKFVELIESMTNGFYWNVDNSQNFKHIKNNYFLKKNIH